jgi:hypothetical protein
MNSLLAQWMIVVLETPGGMVDDQVQGKRTVSTRPTVRSSELKTITFADDWQLPLLPLNDRSSTLTSGSKKAIARSDGSGRSDSISKLFEVSNLG